MVIGANLLAPQALLDGVDSMRLYVADQGESTQCSEETGNVSSDLTQQGAAQAFDLRRGTVDTPCPNDAVFCSEEITLPTDPDRVLVFQAIGYQQGARYAVGCTSAAVNSNPFYVDLLVHRYVPPAQCGNGTIEPGEQCEPPLADANCDDQCRTKEILLSSDNAGPMSLSITNAPLKSKHQVELAWMPGEPLHAVFQDNKFSKTGPEVNYRQLNPDMGTVTSPPLLANQIRLPLQCTGCNVGFEERAFTQGAPSIGLLTDASMLVAYEDSRNSQTSQTNVSVTPISKDAKTPGADEVYIDATTGAGKLQAPSVAGGPQGLALVVWADAGSGAIRGRVWDAAQKWLNTPMVIVPNGASSAKVAGYASGWTVVWQGQSSDGDIWMSRVTSQASVSTPQLVNEKAAGVQSQPAVAFAPSGESIVVWNDGGAIMMQRYSVAGEKVAGDQAAPVSTEGSAESPAVAGSSLGGGFFAIAWQSAGQIFARYAGVGSGYLFNPVDGQDTPFVANYPDTANPGPRALPSVAVGGNNYVAIAWQDESANHFGIWARRFPLPSR